MCALVRPHIHTIKCSVKVSHIPSALQGIILLRANSKYKWSIECDKKASYIFRCPENSIVYQIFYSGHINIAGIPKEVDISHAVSNVCKLIGVPKCVEETVVYSIDNIQASGRLNLTTQARSLKYISDRLNRMKKEWWIDRVSFDTNVFPAIIIKFSGVFNNPNIRGTALVFNSRKFIIVGARRVSDIAHCHDFIETVMIRASEDW